MLRQLPGQFFGLCDISVLRVLVAANEQEDDNATSDRVVNPVARPDEEPKLRDAITYRLGVSEVPVLYAAQASDDDAASSLVPEGG